MEWILIGPGLGRELWRKHTCTASLASSSAADLIVLWHPSFFDLKQTCLLLVRFRWPHCETLQPHGSLVSKTTKLASD